MRGNIAENFGGRAETEKPGRDNRDVWACLRPAQVRSGRSTAQIPHARLPTARLRSCGSLPGNLPHPAREVYHHVAFRRSSRRSNHNPSMVFTE